MMVLSLYQYLYIYPLMFYLFYIVCEYLISAQNDCVHPGESHWAHDPPRSVVRLSFICLRV